MYHPLPPTSKMKDMIRMALSVMTMMMMNMGGHARHLVYDRGEKRKSRGIHDEMYDETYFKCNTHCQQVVRKYYKEVELTFSRRCYLALFSR